LVVGSFVGWVEGRGAGRRTRFPEGDLVGLGDRASSVGLLVGLGDRASPVGLIVGPFVGSSLGFFSGLRDGAVALMGAGVNVVSTEGDSDFVGLDVGAEVKAVVFSVPLLDVTISHQIRS